MDDADAEAVLVALGGALDWRPNDVFIDADGNDFPGVRAVYMPDDNGGEIIYCAIDFGKPKGWFDRLVYFLVPRPFWASAHRRRVGSKPSSPRWAFATLAEAKAACERHHAMGKWDY